MDFNVEECIEHATAINNSKSHGRLLNQLRQESYYSFQDLNERKGWYSSTAKAYDSFRPKYPQSVIDEVVKHISGSRVLEIGCGPGTASAALAKRGFELHCIEPNADFCLLARKNTCQYPKVTVKNISFEELIVVPGEYDALVAATSFHWIPFEVGIPKAAKALRQHGKLILLWNMMVKPSIPEDFDRIVAVHDFLPKNSGMDVMFWKDDEKYKEMSEDVCIHIRNSGFFNDFQTKSTEIDMTYTTEQFLGVLSTYSPYIRLNSELRTELFKRLKQMIDVEMAGKVKVRVFSIQNVITKK